jgi:hypothetical protein
LPLPILRWAPRYPRYRDGPPQPLSRMVRARSSGRGRSGIEAVSVTHRSQISVGHVRRHRYFPRLFSGKFGAARADCGPGHYETWACWRRDKSVDPACTPWCGRPNTNWPREQSSSFMMAFELLFLLALFRGVKGDDLTRPNWQVGFRNISRRAWHGRPMASYHRERDIAATTLPLRRAAQVAGETGPY